MGLLNNPLTWLVLLVYATLIAAIVFARLRPTRPKADRPQRRKQPRRHLFGRRRSRFEEAGLRYDHSPAPSPRQPNGRADYPQRSERAVSQAARSNTVPDDDGIYKPLPDQPRPSAPTEPTRAASPATASPQLTAPEVSVTRFLAPETATSPRFLPGSKAAGMPWLLPAESASPSGIAADQAVLGNLDVRAASVIGSGHRCEEPVKPRQDAYRVARDRSGDFLIVAVADGMADSDRSELGAATAVGTAVALLRRHLDERRPLTELDAAELFRAVSAALIQQAKDRGLDPNDVRTTLAVAVLPTYRQAGPSPKGWVGQIADTHLWLRHDTGWECLTGEAKDSYNGSALSTFLPHTPAAATGGTFAFRDGDTVAVLSDGVADAFSQVPGADGWFAERWRRPPPLASFLLDVDFDARQQLDDRTAVVVWAGRQDPDEAAPR